MTPRECLKRQDDTVPEECRRIAYAFFECKRSIVGEPVFCSSKADAAHSNVFISFFSWTCGPDSEAEKAKPTNRMTIMCNFYRYQDVA